MTEFTPITSFFGGIVIGLAVALLWLGLGRIAGISGITISALTEYKSALSDGMWRWMFVIGIIGGGALYYLLSNTTFSPIAINNPLRIITAGILVGVGTQLGSGCTSGHGICGLSRLSIRSIIATLTFMLAGAITVWLS